MTARKTKRKCFRKWPMTKHLLWTAAPPFFQLQLCLHQKPNQKLSSSHLDPIGWGTTRRIQLQTTGTRTLLSIHKCIFFSLSGKEVSWYMWIRRGQLPINFARKAHRWPLRRILISPCAVMEINSPLPPASKVASIKTLKWCLSLWKRLLFYAFWGQANLKKTKQGCIAKSHFHILQSCFGWVGRKVVEMQCRNNTCIHK